MAKQRQATRSKSKPSSKSSKKPSPSDAALHERARQIVRLLNQAYPGATCALRHRNAYELLVATILSAQCTDERVNMVTPALFARFPDAQAMAQAPRAELERMIQSTGFFRAKAKSIQECCQRLVEHYHGQVPADIDALVKLPGIGRKTANVVLGTAYGLPTGIVVDTHVARIARRLGLSTQKDPNKIEQDLMTLIPKESWIDFSHQLIHHGRRICKARRPLCGQCPLESVCAKIGVEGSAATPEIPARETSRSSKRRVLRSK